METFTVNSAQDNATGEYRQVGFINGDEIGSRIMQIWYLVVITAVAALVFFFLARSLGKLPAAFRIGSRELGIGGIVLVITVLIHEGMHILILRGYGVKPKITLFQNKVLATITVPGYGFRRNTVILEEITPLLVLTCLALLGIWLGRGTPWAALFALVGMVNAVASIGDLWLTAALLRYPPHAWTVNDAGGIRILMPVE